MSAKSKKRKRAPSRSDAPVAASPPTRRRAILVVGVLLCLTSLAIFFYIRSKPKPSAQVADGYVDSSTCVSCHKDVAESFSHTGMGRSIYKPSASNLVEDYKEHNTVFHKPSGMYYAMLRRDDGFYQKRYQIGFSGKESNVVEERIDYVIGAGDHARTYLHRNTDGRLVELPVSWYTEHGGYWAMTPGYEGADQKDFHGVVSKDCIFCHDAYPKRQSPEIEASGEPIFSTLPSGIDCQRCHGPGAKHEDAAARHASDEALVRSTIVNPAHLDRDRQLEVCMQCHLSTSGSQDRNISLRPGRDVFSYKPGESLADYKLYFDAPNNSDKQGFPIADAAYRLRMSSCFRNSTMTCLTCHDPHDQLHGTEATQHYIEACQGCHSAVKHTVALPAAENCLTCHMPKRRGEVAIHTILTDHYIQRTKPTRDLLAPMAPGAPSSASPAGELALYYPPKLPSDPASKLDADVAIADSTSDPRGFVSQFQSDMDRYAPSHPGYFAALGRLYGRAGDTKNAVIWSRKAVEGNPSSHDLATQYVELLVASGDIANARAVLQAVTSHPPADARLLTNLGNIAAQQGNMAEAQTILQQSLSADPELAQTYSLLGVVKQSAGDTAAAEKFYREAIRYRPDLSEARCNLARLLIGSGNLGEAEFELRRAISMAPRSAEPHHILGVLLLQRKAYSPAEQELRTAIALDPKSELSYEALANVLEETGRSSEAAKLSH